MSPEVKSVLVDESAITLTLTIPVDWNADRPLAHLTNEGHIKEGLRQAGQIATQRLYQTVTVQEGAGMVGLDALEVKESLWAFFLDSDAAMRDNRRPWKRLWSFRAAHSPPMILDSSER